MVRGDALDEVDAMDHVVSAWAYRKDRAGAYAAGLT